MRLESFRAVAGRTVHIHQIHRVHEEFQKYDLRHPLTPSSFQGLEMGRRLNSYPQSRYSCRESLNKCITHSWSQLCMYTFIVYQQPKVNAGLSKSQRNAQTTQNHGLKGKVQATLNVEILFGQVGGASVGGIELVWENQIKSIGRQEN